MISSKIADSISKTGAFDPVLPNLQCEINKINDRI
jgi:hypothetical protein